MQISVLSRKLVRELCTNSRVSITELAARYGLSRKMVRDRLAALERELGIRYTLELNYEALGFATLHLVKVRFSEKVEPKALEEVLGRSRVVQLAATTTGAFDMIIFALARNLREYFKWEIGLWTQFSKYGINTSSSEVTVIHLGFVPISDEFIRDSSLKEPYRKVLVELYSNSRMTVRELSKRTGIGETLVAYYLMKLKESGLIKRYTAIVTNPPLRYNIVYFANYTVKEGVESRVETERRTMYWREPDEFPIVNEFQQMFSTSGSDASFTWAVYDNYRSGLERSALTHKRIYKVDAPVIRHATIDRVVKGSLPLRNIQVKDNYDVTFGGPPDI